MGKYDCEIKSSLCSFQILPTRDIKELNILIQNSYKIIYNHCNQHISNIELLSILQELKVAYYNNCFLEIIENKIEKTKNLDSFSKSDMEKPICDIGSATLSIVSILNHESKDNIVRQTLDLYERKNASYNDIWYVRGMEGICIDINRKIVRLNSIIGDHHKIIDGETLFETCIDTLLFSAFLLTSYNIFD